MPDPNCTCKTPLEVNLLTNLLGTFFSFSIFGACDLSAEVLDSSTKIVSCPKNGT